LTHRPSILYSDQPWLYLPYVRPVPKTWIFQWKISPCHPFFRL
jgi:hypothetical protein